MDIEALFEPAFEEPTENRLIVQRNELITAKWPTLTLWESRIFFAALALLHKSDKSFPTTKLYFWKLEKIYGVRISNNDIIIKANRNLTKKSFYIETDKEKLELPLFQALGETHDLKDGYILFKINDLLAYYLLETTAPFTSSEFKNFINLNVSCSRQLYLYLKSRLFKSLNKTFDISFVDLNNLLNKNYKSYYDLDRKILEKSVKEMNGKRLVDDKKTGQQKKQHIRNTDIKVEYFGLNKHSRIAKKNQKVFAVRFNISQDIRRQIGNYDDNYNYNDKKSIINQLNIYGKVHTSTIDKLILKFGFEKFKSDIKLAIKDYNDQTNNHTINNPVGFILDLVKKQNFDKSIKKIEPAVQPELNFNERKGNDPKLKTESTAPSKTAAQPNIKDIVDEIIDHEQIDTVIHKDAIFKQVFENVNKWNKEKLFEKYDSLEISKDEQINLVSKFLTTYHKLKKEVIDALTFHVESRSIPENIKGRKSYTYFVQAVLIMTKIDTKDYDISNLIQAKKQEIENKKAELEPEQEEERRKNEPELSESDIKKRLRALCKEYNKHLNLEDGLTPFYQRLKLFATEYNERLTHSFIDYYLVIIFKTNEFHTNRHFELGYLSRNWEKVITSVEATIENNKRSNKNDDDELGI